MLRASVANVGEVEAADPLARDPVGLTPLRKNRKLAQGFAGQPGSSLTAPSETPMSTTRARIVPILPLLGLETVKFGFFWSKAKRLALVGLGRAYAVWVSGDRRPHRIHVFPEDLLVPSGCSWADAPNSPVLSSPENQPFANRSVISPAKKYLVWYSPAGKFPGSTRCRCQALRGTAWNLRRSRVVRVGHRGGPETYERSCADDQEPFHEAVLRLSRFRFGGPPPPAAVGRILLLSSLCRLVLSGSWRLGSRADLPPPRHDRRGPPPDGRRRGTPPVVVPTLFNTRTSE